MIKKVMIVALLVAFAAVAWAEKKVFPLQDLMNPETVTLDTTQMYVTEGTSIYIYSLKDFKLVKKFGKAGEGPKEFMFDPRMGGLALFLQDEGLVLNSFGKVSWYTKSGEYVKEMKLQHPLTLFMQPFGKNYVGILLAWGKERWKILKLFDDQLNDKQEIIRMPYPTQPGKGTRLLESYPATLVSDNKLFIAWENEFIIKVYDTDLNKLVTVKLDEEKRKVTDEFKKILIDVLRTSPQSKDYFETMKPFYFPDYFPPIRFLFGAGKQIYVITFKQNDADDQECIVLGVDGKLIKRAFLPIRMSTPFAPYPYTIYDNALYQIIEDGDKEEWSIHITEF